MRILDGWVFVALGLAACGSGSEVSWELGATEFREGDGIVLERVSGDRSTLEVGGTYTVEGTYRLATEDEASLLLSITTRAPTGSKPIPEGASMRVSGGEGTFSLTVPIEEAGYPHVTFYGEDGHPFGGVYFGEGDTLLREKSWSYLADR